MARNYREAYARDRKWIMSLDLTLMNKIIWPLFVAFICLSFLDIYTTTLALNFAPLFYEQNPIASALFDKRFDGYLAALAWKYLPVIPLFYIVFVKDTEGRHQVGIRTVKFSALIALIGVDLLLFYIVGINNITALLNLRY